MPSRSHPVPVYVLIGDPVAHSLSPVLHHAALAQASLPGRYEAVTLSTEHFAEGLRAMRAFRPQGVNVTIPHKVAVMAHLDGLTEVARQIGAVNTIFWEGDRWIGDNTDYLGFLRTLPESLGNGSTALILGAGGAARAVALALRERGVTTIHVAARNEDAAAGFRRQILPDRLGEAQSLTDLPTAGALLSGCDLVVNATPLGTRGEGCPLTVEAVAALPDHAIVYDLVYRPRVTPLIRRARHRGLLALDGLDMLIEQAALSFERWTGHSPSRQAMRDAVLPHALLTEVAVSESRP
ncbi:MAG: shikimate dehydrogenase [Candidatus Sericytochromatia bacterium]|nr:shikimate dehydrogenase [Candidatus Sericytochromatia bacterium]